MYVCKLNEELGMNLKLKMLRCKTLAHWHIGTEIRHQVEAMGLIIKIKLKAERGRGI